MLNVKAMEMRFAFFANQLVFLNKVTNERKKSCIMHDMVAIELNFFADLNFTYVTVPGKRAHVAQIMIFLYRCF